MSEAVLSKRGINFGETFREAAGNLRTQGRRSILALLGIMIGTASIIAMLNIGHIAQLETLKLFSNLGVDMLQLRASSISSDAEGFSVPILERIAASDPDVVSLTPFALGRAVVSRNAQQVDVGVAGVTPALTELIELPIRAGRMITLLDKCALVTVVGDTVSTQLSAPGSQLTPGSRIGVGNYLFTVVGILAPNEPHPLNPSDYNNSIMIPLSCVRRVLDDAEPNAAIIKLQPGRDVEAVGNRLSAVLAKPNTSVQVISAQNMIRTMNEQKQVHSQMLAAIGGISLLVGGIGVMNVMLMNVLERRREIGLRAAIGANPRDIQNMFVVEAAILTLVGGFAGTIFGVLASYIFAKSSDWEFEIALYVLFLGPGMSVAVGLIFGLHPAITASRMDPIEALRAE